jgi:hypothetical protein
LLPIFEREIRKDGRGLVGPAFGVRGLQTLDESGMLTACQALLQDFEEPARFLPQQRWTVDPWTEVRLITAMKFGLLQAVAVAQYRYRLRLDGRVRRGTLFILLGVMKVS